MATLRHLNIAYTGLQTLVNCLPLQLVTLNVEALDLAEADLVAIAKLSALEVLRLSLEMSMDLRLLMPLAELNSLMLWFPDTPDDAAHDDRSAEHYTVQHPLVTSSWTHLEELHCVAHLKNAADVLVSCVQLRVCCLYQSLDSQSFSGRCLSSSLEYLDLSFNKLSDLSFLRTCERLRILTMSRNPHLVDISALSACKHLYTLNLDSTAVCDVDVLGQLPMLTLLDLNFTNVRNLTPLIPLRNLTHLKFVATDALRNGHFRACTVVDIAPLLLIPSLKIVCLSPNLPYSIPFETFRQRGIVVKETHRFYGHVHMGWPSSLLARGLSRPSILLDHLDAELCPLHQEVCFRTHTP
eukprot:GILK01010065.1.p1 GENE.GILK01010065.1~~GILK01010065.1.p1  ORF type:complete len:353 (+),score=33.21 GILK01010065.1:1084-2142(+)